MSRYNCNETIERLIKFLYKNIDLKFVYFLQLILSFIAVFALTLLILKICSGKSFQEHIRLLILSFCTSILTSNIGIFFFC